MSSFAIAACVEMKEMQVNNNECSIIWFKKIILKPCEVSDGWSRICKTSWGAKIRRVLLWRTQTRFRTVVFFFRFFLFGPWLVRIPGIPQMPQRMAFRRRCVEHNFPFLRRQGRPLGSFFGHSVLLFSSASTERLPFHFFQSSFLRLFRTSRTDASAGVDRSRRRFFFLLWLPSDYRLPHDGPTFL